jgi:hypothetical protein
MIKYFCCDERRRQAVKAHSRLNGIDFLEVRDDSGRSHKRQRCLLCIHFIKPLDGTLSKENVRIEGGERIRDVVVTGVRSGECVPIEVGDPDKVLLVRVDKPGDFSTYTLRLVRGTAHTSPPEGFDPLLTAVDFSFRVGQAGELDCRPERICPPEPMLQPEISYLAKDYASFRQLMLDRLAILMPDWKERSPADLGMALVELLAYVGDYLSYRQDAVATEAYLDTARRRVSVRRHARLVDYHMHDGCNARVWVQVQVAGGRVELGPRTQLLTTVAGQPVCIQPKSTDYDRALGSGAEVFETKQAARLYPAHNVIHFYTWGARECCLPRGATRATLREWFPYLKAGDVLGLAEVKGPRTGEVEDADPARRHAVRLTHVRLSEDPLGGQFLDEPSDEAVPVTEIQWAAEDALPFPLCISATTDEQHGGSHLEEVSVALGNILLADHGLTISERLPGTVPKSTIYEVQPPGTDSCQRPPSEPVPPRFRPQLKERPLTCAVPWAEKRLFGLDLKSSYQSELDEHQLPEDLQKQFPKHRIGLRTSSLSVQGSQDEWSVSDGIQSYVIRGEDQKLNVYQLADAANKMIRQDERDALPSITLESEEDSGAKATWHPKRNLLNSGPNAAEFVVEIESDGTPYLRFGDNQFGRRPPPETRFSASYRVGNGRRGNIGAEALVHIVSKEAQIKKVWNPLPAQGGVEPESAEAVRQMAPYAFRRQERAVTPEDYAAVANRHPQVQRAEASLRWTGSWHTVFVAVDRLGGLEVDEAFEQELRRFMETFRMAGHDIEIDRPHFVPLEIEMRVHVKSDYFRSHVKAALLRLFSSRTLPDGRRGVFHPDNFTFGQPVYLSRLYAAAQHVDGVAYADITKFQRLGVPSREALDMGKLVLGRLEIARLDNNPNFPERGVFRLMMEGGE